MLVKSRKTSDVRPSEITPEKVYLDRRRFLEGAGLSAAGLVLGTGLLLPHPAQGGTDSPDRAGRKLEGIRKGGPFNTDEELTPYDDVTGYNNFYEFGTGKEDPAENARGFKTRPWSVAVEGEVGKPGVYDLEDLIASHKLEERIYRLRCVETWSMVVPWVGIPLGEMIERFAPTSRAKYVQFETLHDPRRMPGQRSGVLDWPYREGLRIDEAVHPLTILAVGLYGEALPNQNGAPLRLVVPWKYGFKSIKSIVKMRFVETQPATSWNISSAREYGFYANVNPSVDHPRWSQARERRIGDFFKRDTLMFNGYGEEVAHLYAGMDPKRLY